MENKGLEIRNISKKFSKFTALNEINFDVQEGEFVCLLGPSGCGKTTLLRILAGLEKPDQGSLWQGGKEITALPAAGRNFGLVFQSYALFPNLTALENIGFGLVSRGCSKAEVRNQSREALNLVGLADKEEKYPAQLSGGQQQRVALARALALSPKLLLLDEPLSALDAKVRLHLRSEIRKLQEKLGITTIMVTHDQEEALTMSDRIVVMNNACVEQIGSPEEIYENPRTLFVADFIGSINFIKKQDGSIPTQGIRPEYVKISSEIGQVSSKAKIEQIEFRGSSYRILLGLAENQSLFADVSPEKMSFERFEKDQWVNFELPKGKILNYSPENFLVKQEQWN